MAAAATSAMASSTDKAIANDIRLAEERLRLAMLANDIAELDALIDDRLLFVTPDAQVHCKQDDLDLYRTGLQQISRLELIEVRIEVHASVAITVVLAQMAGRFKGHAFEGRYRYVRCWALGAGGWRIAGGSVTLDPSYKVD
jgi:Domain of unknown function (DUF4440)